MEIGLAVAGNLQDVAALASRAEAAGIESVWLAELDRSAFVQAAVAISATSRIGVGTAVALAFPRSPTVTAMTAWDLDEMSGDRFLMGLGPQVKRVMEARFSVRVEKPAPQMREYVQAVRTVWAANRGEPVVHAGEVYRITMPTFHGPLRPERRDTPILIAAVGPVMSRVCGEVANGLLGHPLAPLRPDAPRGSRSPSTPRRPPTSRSWRCTAAARFQGIFDEHSSIATRIEWPSSSTTSCWTPSPSPAVRMRRPTGSGPGKAWPTASSWASLGTGWIGSFRAMRSRRPSTWARA